MVDPELDVEVVEVLVEEEVEPRLEVPAVGAVDAGAAKGKIARRESARVTPGRLEVIVGDVRRDEAVPIASTRGEARPGVGLPVPFRFKYRVPSSTNSACSVIGRSR